jgi:hypothetical protein
MANTIQLRRSATASAVPTTTQLALGELAINTYDGKLYLKKNVSGTETVVEVGAGGGGSASITISDTAPASPTNGALWWNSSVGQLKIYYTDANSSQWIDAISASSIISAKRTVVVATGTSISINADVTDTVHQANTQVAGTLTINAPTGTPIDNQQIMIKIKSTNVQTFAWNAIFKGSTDLPLPTATSGSSLTDYIGFTYDASVPKWNAIAKNFGF